MLLPTAWIPLSVGSFAAKGAAAAAAAAVAAQRPCSAWSRASLPARTVEACASRGYCPCGLAS